jgi:capsular polysaccharide biosynthesis protein
LIDGAVATRNPSRVDATGPVRPGGQSGDPPRRSGRRGSGPGTGTGGFFPVIRRWWIVIAVATGIALLVGYGLARQATPTYQARSDVLVGPLAADIATIRASTAATGTYVQLAGAPATLEAVARTTGVDRDLLYSGVRVSTDPEARLLRIRARAHTPEDAAAVANAVADRLIGLAADDSTEPAGRLRVVDEAEAPSAPISPRTEVIVPLAAVGGLLGGLALVMVLELVGDGAGSVREVRRAARTPGLTLSPASRRPEGERGGQVVATHLDLVRPGATSVLVSGTSGHDGGGRLALELAAAWAAGGHRVVVVDADAGETTAVLGLGERPGVADALAGRDAAPTALGGGVEAMGAAPAGARGPVAVEDARRVVADLVDDGARVVVHAPPVASDPATLAWARAVATTVLVTRRDTGRRAPLVEAADALRRVGADVALTVLHPGGRAGPLAVAAPRLRPTLRPTRPRTRPAVPA